MRIKKTGQRLSHLASSVLPPVRGAEAADAAQNRLMMDCIAYCQGSGFQLRTPVRVTRRRNKAVV